VAHRLYRNRSLRSKRYWPCSLPSATAGPTTVDQQGQISRLHKQTLSATLDALCSNIVCPSKAAQSSAAQKSVEINCPKGQFSDRCPRGSRSLQIREQPCRVTCSLQKIGGSQLDRGKAGAVGLPLLNWSLLQNAFTLGGSVVAMMQTA
jgi:hypothetical protein